MKNTNSIPFAAIVSTIRRTVRPFKDTALTEVAESTRDPFRVLISCIISLRTKDEVTAEASARLFAHAATPEKMRRLSAETIETLIYPAGFYRNKAKNILQVCDILVEQHGGRVPDRLEDLLALPGVGRKTANLVLSVGFRIPAICVDTHVHRIANRMGWVQTKTPEQTEMALMEVLPKKHWIEINDLLVSFGQNICKPISPFCSRCPVAAHCTRVGVERSR
ncbi:MAG: endonuclease III [candidate division KSB1 bacterium]|nr:endonuclease III [candidate division KSB1 bacterium]MDQ7065240.1 endonuclease III [candidate division KSB1 bacterium]